MELFSAEVARLAAPDTGAAPTSTCNTHAPQRCVELFSAEVARLAAPDTGAAPEELKAAQGFLNYAQWHYDVIAKWGRFPHRNALLGRCVVRAAAAALCLLLRRRGGRARVAAERSAAPWLAGWWCSAAVMRGILLLRHTSHARTTRAMHTQGEHPRGACRPGRRLHPQVLNQL